LEPDAVGNSREHGLEPKFLSRLDGTAEGVLHPATPQLSYSMSGHAFFVSQEKGAPFASAPEQHEQFCD
jgi:hypothetical protein